MRKLLSATAWIVTAYTVAECGLVYAAVYTAGLGEIPSMWSTRNLALSMCYTLPVLAILAANGSGYWMAARKHKEQSLWTIPLPVPAGWLGFIPVTGVIGLVRGTKNPVTRPLAIWDMAFLSLLCTFGMTVIVTLAGIWLSAPGALPGRPGRWTPYVFELALSEKSNWHPMAAAAWFGWWYTAVTMMPFLPNGIDLVRTAPDVWVERRWSVLSVAGIAILSWL